MSNQAYALALSLVTQGSTAGASRVKITATDTNGNRVRNLTLARVRICNSGVSANSTNATIAPANGSSTFETITSTKDLVLKNGVGAAASGTLTVSSGALHLEAFVIGPRTYIVDALGTLVANLGEVMVDISGVSGLVAASGVLTLAANPTAGDTMTIGTKSYTFMASGLANSDGEIMVGTNLAATKLNVVAAILGTDGFNEPHDLVTCAAAFSSDTLAITARIPGTAANSIATVETYTSGSNIFGAATLASGANPSASNTATAFRTAINGDSGRVVAAGGSSGTVTVTARETGTAANSYATTETLSGSSWGAATLASGVEDDPGVLYVDVTDASAETVTLRVGNPPVGGPALFCTASLDITHA